MGPTRSSPPKPRRDGDGASGGRDDQMPSHWSRVLRYMHSTLASPPTSIFGSLRHARGRELRVRPLVGAVA